MTLAVDGKTHIATRVRSPISGMISPNISLKCSLLLGSCQWSVFKSRCRVGPWSMNVSFPGHTHFFDQTVNRYDISDTPCSHVYLKE